MHKLDHQIRRALAAKRSVERELGDNLLGAIPPAVLARKPSPLEALTLADELEQFLLRLEPMHRRVVELRLQGYNHEEIAVRIDRCERTVRRVLDYVKEQLAKTDFLRADR